MLFFYTSRMTDTCVIIEQMNDKAKDALLSEAIEMIGKLTDAQLYRIMEEMKNDEPAE